ncbi:Uncharacterised protein [Burkholderia pseudomallei]|nr:Uncharacterised protein [Burkholderia pseudomallei]
MTNVATRYAHMLADLAKAGVSVTVTENRDGQLVSVSTSHGVHVFTVSREVAFEVGLLERTPRPLPANRKS